MDNLIIDTDSYKASHWKQYPEGTTSMTSYFEARVGAEYGSTVFFGLQYILKKYLTKKITMPMVWEANKFFKAHGVPFNFEDWAYIASKLDGKLPVKIRAIPEGTVVPINNVLMTIESTDPRVFWVVSWLETMLVRLWYPITVATRSYYCKKIIKEYLEKTSDDWKAEIPFKLHDFGSRGVSSLESACIGGAAHLVNFMGSDTCAGIYTVNKYYDEDMAAFSIPAAEHSTITAYGKENEVEAFRNMLKQYAKPNALVAVVSDSWDIENAVDNLWGKELKDEVIKSGATVIIRPDSGNPPDMVLKVLQLLEQNYGTMLNTKGYKVLNNVRVIQGDGITIDSLRQILKKATDAGFSATNLAFGMGGGLLQQLDRDTQRFAFKCCHMIIDGKSRDIFKNPASDPTKASKAGKQDLIIQNGKFKTVKGEVWNSLLATVYENGEIKETITLAEIRSNVNDDIL